jgi:response regulator RpfG family c-di-GMP phosphodiesterase
VKENDSPRILVVDDDDSVRDVISVLLTEEGYACSPAKGADHALELAAESETHLVISDMKMPVHDGLWLLDEFRRQFPETAVIMLTGYGDTETAVECLRRGATDYLLKPPKVTDLVRAVERALAKRNVELERKKYQRRLERRVREKTADLENALKDIERAYSETLLALVSALDAREHETGDHSQRVVRVTVGIAQRMGLTEPILGDIGRGALLHDIGKIGIPDAILLKPGPLTPSEWVEMRRHPEIGFSIIKNIPFLRTPAEIVLSHQERFDGGGYPRGLKGDEIHVGARIFAVADTIDAITSDRPYRRGAPYKAARDEIQRCSGTQFDPKVVEALVRIDEDEIEALRRKSDSIVQGLSPSAQP